MIIGRRGIRAFATVAAIAFLVSSATFSEAGRRFYGSSGSSGGSSGSYGSSGGSSGSYGSSGGIVHRRVLRHGSRGSSGGYHHSSGRLPLASHGSSGGYHHSSHGSSGGYSHGYHGSSGGSTGGIILQAPTVRSYPVPAPAPVNSKRPKPPTPVNPKSYTPLKAPTPVAPKIDKKDDQARMIIHVPEDAIVSLNYQRMAVEGKTRRFISPVLPTQNEYSYSVSVEVIRDGQPVTIVQKQIIRAGGNYELTFVEQNGALVLVAPAQKMTIAAQ